MKKILKILGALVGLIVIALVAMMFLLRHPKPTPAPGPAGDELARRVAASVNADAWNRISIIRFTLAGNRHFLWDKAHGFVRVRLKDDEVLLDLMKLDGRAFHAGVEQSGDAKKRLLDRAYKFFCNDSFWLNPLAKLFDDGTSRTALTVDGKPALLISYASGGVTPGDSYLWLLDDNAHPRAWRIYAQVLKLVPGVEMTWDDWTRIGDGAEVSTGHHAIGLHLQSVTNLAGASRVEDLEPGPDPFATLASKR
jgi:hypothetical protein